jgi:hypothetical protein
MNRLKFVALFLPNATAGAYLWKVGFRETTNCD